MINKICFLLVLLCLFSCKKDKPIVSHDDSITDTPAITSVVVEAKNNPGKIPADVKFTINKGVISVLIPYLKIDKKLVLTFATRYPGTIVRVNDTIIVSGKTVTDFSKKVTYSVTTPKGITQKYAVIVKSFTGIPILYLHTDAPVVSKKDYVTGRLVVDPNTQFNQEKTTIPLEVRGRGNSTWDLPKKPYRLKFITKAPMLGMPEARNWVLLANHADKTLLRTNIAFETGRKLGADFTPEGRHVELVLNGEYAGNYLLTNQVEVHENRVNIPELKPGNVSAEEITGGYLLELDQRMDEDFWFSTKRVGPFAIKSPDDITEVQLNYIKNYVQDAENALFADNFTDPETGYAKYIDVNSFINWFLVQELLKNMDSKGFSSIFYYKNRGGKLGMGPIWDFDVSIGNITDPELQNPVGWWVKDGIWFKRLFEDPNFRSTVKKRWSEVKRAGMVSFTPFIDSTANYINLSQKKNFERWPIMNVAWPKPVALGSYEKEVAEVKNWLTRRATWMDAQINSF
ncbi:hypothetical protein DJ568_16740 [Mucilaginibacter hurinus]|uniref:Spore coat protein CotH n=1 Tax=Mucilaginibacter hurinus TaxID=2201324 RepID=A0A367GJQ1_9SPHI|nr:CotH kinase family protein [Mucilaginibacter hurinus]RCH53682.1 hypothetical protein DJ568_16740 [Mucilaginibacter hurinus]